MTSPLAGQMFFRMSLFSVFGGAKRWLGTNPDGSARQLTTADFFKARHQLHTCQPIARELQQCHDHLHATCRADDRPGPAIPARLCPVWRRCCRLHRPRTAQATLCSQRSPNGGVTVAAGQCTASNYRQPSLRGTAEFAGSTSSTFGVCRDAAHCILGTGGPPHAPAEGSRSASAQMASGLEP